jgi:hypothetical protein
MYVLLVDVSCIVPIYVSRVDFPSAGLKDTCWLEPDGEFQTACHHRAECGPAVGGMTCIPIGMPMTISDVACAPWRVCSQPSTAHPVCHVSSLQYMRCLQSNWVLPRCFITVVRQRLKMRHAWSGARLSSACTKLSTRQLWRYLCIGSIHHCAPDGLTHKTIGMNSCGTCMRPITVFVLLHVVVFMSDIHNYVPYSSICRRHPLA